MFLLKSHFISCPYCRVFYIAANLASEQYVFWCKVFLTRINSGKANKEHDRCDILKKNNSSHLLLLFFSLSYHNMPEILKGRGMSIHLTTIMC